MLIQWITLVCAAHAAIGPKGAVQIFGEVSFDLRVSELHRKDEVNEIQNTIENFKSEPLLNESLQSDSTELKKMETLRESDIDGNINDADGNDDTEIDDGSATDYGSDIVDLSDSGTKNTTAAPQAACDYQYPEQKQTDAILSYMMNQLTKMFMRLSTYMRRVATRADAHYKKRFTQIPTDRSDFFEEVYFNMTHEFQRACEAARSRVVRLRSEKPCAHQRRPLRAAWAHVLRASEYSLGRAAKRMLRWHLRATPRAGPDANLTARVSRHAAKFLRHELTTVHTDQLEMLCDKFKLCYHDLVTTPADDNLSASSIGSPSSMSSVIGAKKIPTTTPAYSPIPVSTRTYASPPTPASFTTPLSSSMPASFSAPAFSPWIKTYKLSISNTTTSSLVVLTTTSKSPQKSPLPSQELSPSHPAVTTGTSSVRPITNASEPSFLAEINIPDVSIELSPLLKPRSAWLQYVIG